jgi:hypothetical protein
MVVAMFLRGKAWLLVFVAMVMTADATGAQDKKIAHCDDVEITVGQNERRCFKSGVGKTAIQGLPDLS